MLATYIFVNASDNMLNDKILSITAMEMLEVRTSVFMAYCVVYITHVLQHKQALETAQLTTEYERSAAEVRLTVKDEELRKLRVRILLLEDEVDFLNGQLAKEEEHVDGLQRDLSSANDQLLDMDSNSQKLQNDLRVKERELNLLKVGSICKESGSSTNIRMTG